ncbi:MAG: hypothetical protein AAB758_02260 [Patescibacteria group bacterium]
MNEWSRTRKRIILGIILFVLIVVIGIPLFFLFYNKPSCFDKKLNGDETGMDCGGSCQLLCSAESLPIVAKGDPRVLKIASSTYEVVALFENPNPTAEIRLAHYTLKIFDKDNSIPIRTIEGNTYIPKNTIFAVFEGPFTVETGVEPVRATLEWAKGSLIWQKNTYQLPEIIVKDKVLSKESSSPRLEAIVENASLEDIENLDIIVLISDEDGNIFAASKTFIDFLPSAGETPVIFSWPRAFAKKAAQIDVIVRILPDKSFIK